MRVRRKESSDYVGVKEVTVPIYGTIPFKTEHSPYDRCTASLDAEDGLFVLIIVDEDGKHFAMEPRKFDYMVLKSKITEPYEFGGAYFRYNVTDTLVRHLYKASDEEVKNNDAWKAKYGKQLYHIDEYGFICIQSVGLSREHWFNQEVRDEYLAGYLAEYQVESEHLAAMAAYEFRDLI